MSSLYAVPLTMVIINLLHFLTQSIIHHWTYDSCLGGSPCLVVKEVDDLTVMSSKPARYKIDIFSYYFVTKK